MIESALAAAAEFDWNLAVEHGSRVLLSALALAGVYISQRNRLRLRRIERNLHNGLKPNVPSKRSGGIF